MTAPVVGIDLGTTNTVVGVVRDGHAAAIGDEDGERLIPSVVSFHPSGSVLVGRTAKARRLVDAPNTIYSIKRLIGRSWDSEEVKKARERFPFQMSEGPGQAALVVARGQSYTLPEISAFVLRRARAVAEAGLGENIEKAVITVPANFNDLQRAATKVAGRVAGLEVLRILNEPTAAALAYGYGKGTSERIAVYDFGGGTFNVTLLDLSENVFEVLATAGNTFLGGDDIDLLIAERMADSFLARHKSDPRTDPQAFERLRAGAETLKIQLSRETEAHIRVTEVAHGPGGRTLDLDFSMTKAEFDALSGPIVDRTFDVCREAMNIARMSAGDFDQVLLVGGSTRIPIVRERVEEFFKRPVLGHISPDEVVAIGAAIQAAALTGAERRRDIPIPPQPAARTEGSQAGRKGTGTLPPGALPPGSFDPSTHPYGGAQPRARMPTNPGIQADSGARHLPPGLAQRVVVAPPGSSVPETRPPVTADRGAPRKRRDTGPGLGIPPVTEPPHTVAGLGARGRFPTGPGLGPEAAAARARAAGPTLTSAADAAEQAQRAAGALPIDLPPSQVGADNPTHEAQQIAGFLARHTAQAPQKRPSGTSQPAQPQPPPPPQRRPPPPPQQPVTEESVSALLDEDDINYEDPSTMSAMSVQPTTEQLRQMAGPQSTDEVTEVHKRLNRQSGRRTFDELSLPVPGMPDMEDSTLETATAPGNRNAPGGTLAMPEMASTNISPQMPGISAPMQHSPPIGAPSPGTAPMAAFGPAPWEMQTGAPQVPFGGAPPAAVPPPMPAAPPPMQAFGGVAAPMPGGAPHAPLLVDVTPLTLAVETVQGYCDPVIARNTPVPCERLRAFVTAGDNQTTVRVRVSQGESTQFRENTPLGEVELSGLRAAPRGQVKIDVTFSLDTDGILSVRATDVATGREATATLRLIAMPDMGQIGEMAARQAQVPIM